MCEDSTPGRMWQRFVGVSIDKGICGAVGAKVNEVSGTIDTCTVEEVRSMSMSMRWRWSLGNRWETAIAMRAMAGRACWNRWSVRDDGYGLEARL